MENYTGIIVDDNNDIDNILEYYTSMCNVSDESAYDIHERLDNLGYDCLQNTLIWDDSRYLEIQFYESIVGCLFLTDYYTDDKLAFTILVAMDKDINSHDEYYIYFNKNV